MPRRALAFALLAGLSFAWGGAVFAAEPQVTGDKAKAREWADTLAFCDGLAFCGLNGTGSWSRGGLATVNGATFTAVATDTASTPSGGARSRLDLSGTAKFSSEYTIRFLYSDAGGDGDRAQLDDVYLYGY